MAPVFVTETHRLDRCFGMVQAARCVLQTGYTSVSRLDFHRRASRNPVSRI